MAKGGGGNPRGNFFGGRKSRNRKGDRGGQRSRYDESIDLPRDRTYPPGTPLDEILADLKKRPRSLAETDRILKEATGGVFVTESNLSAAPGSILGTTALKDDTALLARYGLRGKGPASKPPVSGKPNLPLMDLVNAFTFEKKLSGIPFKPSVVNVLRKYRIELRRSERFVLDDDAVRLACDLSAQASNAANHDLLRGWAYLARLPYDDMWIELNLHAKVKRFAELGSLRGDKPELDQISPVIGYQFSRDDELGSPTRWIARDFVLHPDGSALPGMLSYVFDPEATELEPVRSSRKWGSPTLSARPNAGKIPGRVANSEETLDVDPEDVLLGTLDRVENHPSYRDAIVTMDVGSKGIAAPPWLRAKLAVIADPFWEAYIRELPPAQRDNAIDLIQRDVLEQAGVARWLIALLGAINAVPRDVVPVPARPGRRHVGANILPYFQHRTLRLQLPRDDRVVYAIERMTSREAEARRNSPRPWHQVRGHWRIVERGKTTGRRRGQAWCRHVPAATDEAGHGRCARCGLIVAWVAQHHRGDPTVGIVAHTYLITGKK